MKKLNTNATLTSLTLNDNYVLKDDEYIKDGQVFCKKCNTPRSITFENKTYYNLLCNCREKHYENEEALKEQKEIENTIFNLKTSSLLGKRYYDVTFANTIITNESFKIAYERCKKYCDNYKLVLEKGFGIYLWGSPGVGKTHLTACMVNELSKNLQLTLLTNFFEISREIRRCFKENISESAYIDKLANIDFLFIDDLGTELVKKNGEDNFLQEKIFEILNLRYNNLKPTIFSSNNSLKELVTEKGFMIKTVDRIREMSTAIIKIEGTSYRQEKSELNIF